MAQVFELLFSHPQAFEVQVVLYKLELEAWKEDVCIGAWFFPELFEESVTTALAWLGGSLIRVIVTI